MCDYEKNQTKIKYAIYYVLHFFLNNFEEYWKD